MRAILFSLLMLVLAGCATSQRDTEAEARGYGRGYAQAVKEQYWIIQNQQRAPSEKTPPAGLPLP